MLSMGETVRWISQAQGHTKTKEGMVVAIVNPGERPSEKLFPDLYQGAGPGYGRKAESYVVKVGNKHYWPLANKLIRV